MKKKLMILFWMLMFSFLFAGNVKADGNIHSLCICSRYVNKQGYNKFIKLLKANKIPNFKTNYSVYGKSYYYNTDAKKNNKISESDFWNLIKNAYENSKDNDLNIFYYGGHTYGKKSGRSDRIVDTGIYIGDTDNKYIPYGELVKKLCAYKGTFILVIDSCFSGEVISRIKELGTGSNRFIVMTATKNLEEFSDLFSNKLYSALNPSNYSLIDANRDGCINAPEIFSYIPIKGSPLNPQLFCGTNELSKMTLFQFGYIKLKEANVSLSKSTKTYTIKYSVKNKDRGSKRVVFKSENTNVAKVNSKGVVTAVGNGSTHIIVSLADSNGIICNGSGAKLKISVTGINKQINATMEQNKRALSAYKKFLSSSQPLTCQGITTKMTPDGFYVYDVDGDGIKDLIVSDKDICSNTKYFKHCHVILYKWHNNKVTVADGILTTQKNTKSIRLFKSLHLVSFLDYYNKWYAVSINGTWSNPKGSYTTVKLYSNTANNRKRYIK